MKRTILLLSFLCLATHSLLAQDHEFYPGARYKATVPTPKSYLGYELGEYFTDHHQMEGYIHELQKAAAERVMVLHTGRSEERRNTYVVIISSAENMKRLENIRSAVVSLRDPREVTQAEADKIAAETPAIAFMNYANDGNESAAFEACLQVAYHFAAGEDAETVGILKNAIIVLNPAHNPESHQRYNAWMKASVVGPKGTADPNAAEHRGDWRMSTNNNHYQIDLNRDGFALSQVETRIVAKQLHHWSPQVFVDHHGETNEFFFAPYAAPVNLNLPASVKKWATVIGQNNASAFDNFKWSYFAKETFDLHYPGYWDSYPAFNGAIGMTYETNGGGRKGLRFERADKTILTFHEGIHHHVVASIATVKSTADNRQAMLRDFYAFFKTGMDEAKTEPIKQLALLPGKDPGRTADLVDLLRQHKIEVFAAQEKFSSRGALNYHSGQKEDKEFPAGTFIVPFAQPQKRLAKALLELDAGMDQEFIDDATRKYKYNKSLGSKAPKQRLGFYDVTAWSLPLAFGVEAYGLGRAYGGDLQRVDERPGLTGGILTTNGQASYGFAFSYETNSGAKLLAQLLKEDFKLAITLKPFTSNGDSFPRGTVIARAERNRDTLQERVEALSQAAEVPVYAISSAWTHDGILLGSNNVVNLKKPRIAVVTEEPTRQTSYGAIWYLLERQYEIDFTAIRLDYFQRIDLYDYNVLVLPPGSAAGYERALGKKGIDKIKEWVRNGGTFVGIAEGAVFAAGDKVQLTKAKLLGAKKAKTSKEGEKSQGEQAEAEAEGKEEKKPDMTPGAILRVQLDTNHFMSLGYEETVPVLVRSSNIFTPTKDGVNVGLFAENEPRMSGFIWEETEKMFPGNAYLIDEPVGTGHAILFAEEPIFRLYWRGTERLFLSSLLIAPSF